MILEAQYLVVRFVTFVFDCLGVSSSTEKSLRLAYYLSCYHSFCVFSFLTDLGLQQHRLENEEYIEVIDEFMEAVFTRWPHVIVQVNDPSLMSGISDVSYNEPSTICLPAV